jgi:hypothetical protein
MTKDQAIKQLNAIPNGDVEAAHIAADQVLLEFLRANGFAEVADAWTTLEKRCDGFWYA